jgi:uncharacterized protein (DUF362 family)
LRRFTRSEFLKLAALGGAGATLLSACGGSGSAPVSGEAPAARNGRQTSPSAAASSAPSTLAVATGASPADNTARALAALGGMAAFVRPGDVVVVKPNIVTARAPEYAATTNPEVVAALVRLAREAGAKEVLVMDNPTSDPEAAYEESGIAAAAKAAGGSVRYMSEDDFRDYAIPGTILGRHPLCSAIVEADVLISVPIAKHHGSAGLTLAGKNLMGACDDRGRLHRAGLSRGIAELAAALRPELAVVDATRILVRNGPNGGDLEDVVVKDTVIACADWVAADAYTTGLFGLTPADVPYIGAAAQMGLGSADPRSLAIENV